MQAWNVERKFLCRGSKCGMFILQRQVRVAPVLHGLGVTLPGPQARRADQLNKLVPAMMGFLSCDFSRFCFAQVALLVLN